MHSYRCSSLKRCGLSSKSRVHFFRNITPYAQRIFLLLIIPLIKDPLMIADQLNSCKSETRLTSHDIESAYASGGWITSEGWNCSVIRCFRYWLEPKPPTRRMGIEFWYPAPRTSSICRVSRTRICPTILSKTCFTSSWVTTKDPFSNPTSGLLGIRSSTGGIQFEVS